MKETVNDMPSNMTKIDFDLIRGWISEHLKTPNEIVHSEGRNVIVSTELGLKEFTIPRLSEDNKVAWKKSWLDVYDACLDALQLKVNRIYLAGKKEGYIIQTSPNEVRVGLTIIKIADDHNSVAYARALEKIISTYKKIKEEEAKRINSSPISVNRSTINIGASDKAVANMYKVGNDISTVKEKVVTPKVELPKQETILKTPLKHEEDRVSTVRMAMPKPIVEERKPKEENSDKRQVIIQKIPDNVSLDKNDCEIYKTQPLVIASCVSVKNGDGVFRDNIDILRENIPNISIGSFIRGKSTNTDQAEKETTRMLKLLNECQVSKLVIYEINNDYIANHLKKKDCIEEIMEAANNICAVLMEEKYYPILCMDLDTYESIKTVLPEYKEKYPIIKCVTPKQKDMVSNSDDILYMNPSSDSDAVMVYDENMQTSLRTIPQKESYSNQIA